MNQTKSKLVVLSSPSGGGKTTIAKALVNRNPRFRISVSATTRKPRKSEKEGVDYFFLSTQEFFEKVNNKEFLEYEEVHGHYYGTLKRVVEELLDKEYTVVFDIDVYGALHIKKLFPAAILIFLRPPSLDALKGRLRNRRTDNEQEIEKRLDRLPREYEMAEFFDYDITNNELQATILNIEKIIFKK